MRDPLDELENFATPGLTMDPLPASEVRRRGTRMRRRNNALATLGGVAAVAIIATPLAMAASHDRTDTTPPPATQSPSPTATWVREIPADLPLEAGLAAPVETSSTYESPVTEVCARASWGPAGTVDLRQTTHQEPEGRSTHTLAVYPTEREATMALMPLAAELQACALQTDGKARWAEALPSDLGDESLVYVNHYSDAGDIDVVQLVRVGNAILEATSYSNGVPVQDTVDDVSQDSTVVIDAMCAFSTEPC